ncbi:hypothetical protein KDA_41830 [Dictyobacter alpinus]|uniref:Uncharacterized protein n=1 Tax=Dictyobacter alpinus TaxID=2014873 RepID=A0A402BBI8_9CHLR|nr:hypothetical protein [Dictyobacter alpinus]GCE28699.1 hypothetical protein KDA_41830 [Dictyobacter alpinus]
MHQAPEQIVYQAIEQGVHGMIVIGAGILYGCGGGVTPSFWLSPTRAEQVLGWKPSVASFEEDLRRTNNSCGPPRHNVSFHLKLPAR